MPTKATLPNIMNFKFLFFICPVLYSFHESLNRNTSNLQWHHHHAGIDHFMIQFNLPVYNQTEGLMCVAVDVANKLTSKRPCKPGKHDLYWKWEGDLLKHPSSGENPAYY